MFRTSRAFPQEQAEPGIAEVEDAVYGWRTCNGKCVATLHLLYTSSWTGRSRRTSDNKKTPKQDLGVSTSESGVKITISTHIHFARSRATLSRARLKALAKSSNITMSCMKCFDKKTMFSAKKRHAEKRAAIIKREHHIHTLPHLNLWAHGPFSRTRVNRYIDPALS